VKNGEKLDGEIDGNLEHLEVENEMVRRSANKFQRYEKKENKQRNSFSTVQRSDWQSH